MTECLLLSPSTEREEASELWCQGDHTGPQAHNALLHSAVVCQYAPERCHLLDSAGKGKSRGHRLVEHKWSEQQLRDVPSHKTHRFVAQDSFGATGKVRPSFWPQSNRRQSHSHWTPGLVNKIVCLSDEVNPKTQFCVTVFKIMRVGGQLPNQSMPIMDQ